MAQGIEFLGYEIKQGKGRLQYRQGGPDLYAYPRDRTIERFKNRVRHITTRRNPKELGGLLDELNPVIRGWGNYYGGHTSAGCSTD